MIEKSLFPLKFWLFYLSLSILGLLMAPGAQAELNPDLLKMDIEELMKVEVTSAAKRPQRLHNVPAAVYVLNQSDIHRTPATTIPKLLRLVPGVHVGRITSSDWAISIRGFNDRFANKLLVLMDGRTLYTPIFSGVFWERQDTVLQDIDRIEVVRGPGASLWGANAVNGVINIITKSAWETQGWLLSPLVGDEESGFTLRYGGKVSNQAAYRWYVKAKEIDHLKDIHDKSQPDDWRYIQGGFRLDWKLSEGKIFTLQGDSYYQTNGVLQTEQLLYYPYERKLEKDGFGSGSNIIAKYSAKDKEGYGLLLRAYYDYANASNFPLFNWRLHTLDFELQHSFKYNKHKFIWGGGYRLYIVNAKNTPYYGFYPKNSKLFVFNAFMQDEFKLNDNLFLTIGNKLEYHEETKFEIQPTIRLLWNINDNNVVWFAISRAVRTPAVGEMDAVIDTIDHRGNIPIVIQLQGNKDLDSEKLISFEMGLRKNIRNKASLDITAFMTKYDDLIALPFPHDPPIYHPTPAPYLFLKTKAKNLVDGETYGLEIASNLDLTRYSRLKLAYTYLKLFLHAKEPTLWHGEELENQWPRHILSILWQTDLHPDIHLDFWFRYVDDISNFHVPSYWATDFQLTWHINQHLDFSLSGENIFDPGHPEFAQNYLLKTPLRQVPRSFYARLIWHL